jgi:hypothetical protein
MTIPSTPTQSRERLYARAIAALVPFFADGPTGNANVAHRAAESLLSDYNASTPKELQLSAQIIALGWASMACLRTAMAAKNLSVSDRLRLQDDAIALDRASQKAAKALEGRRKERAKTPLTTKPENIAWDEGAFQLTMNQALAKLMDANARLAAYMALVAPPVVPKPKLSILYAERMTPSVLARRARH